MNWLKIGVGVLMTWAVMRWFLTYNLKENQVFLRFSKEARAVARQRSWFAFATVVLFVWAVVQ